MVEILRELTLVAVSGVAVSGCGNPSDASDAAVGSDSAASLDSGIGSDATTDSAAPSAAACVARGGQCVSYGSFCLASRPEDCGSNAYCCVDAICAPDASLPPIMASSYDQSCASDSDCVAVSEGDICTPCGIGCTNAGINIGSEAQYKADVAKAYAATQLGSPYQCVTTCPFARKACCVGGRCHADSTCPSAYATFDAGAGFDADDQ